MAVPALGLARWSGVHRRRNRDPRGQRPPALRVQVRRGRGPPCGNPRRADPPRRRLRAAADPSRVADTGLPDRGVPFLMRTWVVVAVILSVLVLVGSVRAEERFLDRLVARVD